MEPEFDKLPSLLESNRPLRSCDFVEWLKQYKSNGGSSIQTVFEAMTMVDDKFYYQNTLLTYDEYSHMIRPDF